MAKHKKCTKLGEWQKRAKNGGECEECHQYKKALTVDHIVPKHIVEQLDETGGAIYEMDDNFQMLCSVCNAFKGGKIKKRDSRTKEILLKLLST